MTDADLVESLVAQKECPYVIQQQAVMGAEQEVSHLFSVDINK